jgi:tetratricopeptide (TPR) repeat protein
VWQQFLVDRSAATPFAFLSVAVDVDPEGPRRLASLYSFPTAIDRLGVLGRTFDFDVVPNCLFLDEAGVIRFLHIGGFEVRRPEIVEQVDALLHADFAGGEQPTHVVQEPLDIELLRAEVALRPEEAALHHALGEALFRAGRAGEATDAFRRASELDPSDWSAAFALGTALYQLGDRDGALHWWRTARERDPANFTVRKQIWRVEHPEKFYPTIDPDWQREQLVKEGYRR